MDSRAPINKQEVLRYLGHKGQAVDTELDQLIDAAIAQCEQVARPKFVYRLFDLERRVDGIALSGTTLTLTGQAIAQHLAGAERCALLAATLGGDIETHIRIHQQRDSAACLALDAAAADCIEKVCDQAGEEIRQAAEREGRYTGARFSPGYGDLPLDIQPTVIQVLDTPRKIGLTCSPSLILLPRKSVTAVIGLFDRPVDASPLGCDHCTLRDRCTFRKSGGSCGRS